MFGVDPKLDDERVEQFAQSFFDGDPEAEALQAAGTTDLVSALTEEVRQPPPWLDRAQLDRGARVFRRWGRDLFSLAGAITLHGYRESSVAVPLAKAGGYVGGAANRRFLETARFWVDVAAPGGLDEGAPGFATALKVRALHARVRQRLLADPDWDLDAWGVPINQGDATMTLLGGSFLPGVLLRVLGHRTSRADIEDTLHLWRYVGHLMGIRPRFMPVTFNEALKLAYTSEVKGARTSGEHGRKLASSYLDLYRPIAEDGTVRAWSKRWEAGLQRGFVRLFLPSSSRRGFGLNPGAGWALLLMARAPAVFALQSAGQRLPTLEGALDAWTHQRAERWVQDRLEGRRPLYVGRAQASSS